MSTTPDRGHSFTSDVETRPRTTLVRSATSTRHADSTRTTPTPSSTSTSSSHSSTPVSSVVPSVRIAIATSTPTDIPFAAPTDVPTSLTPTCSKDSDCAEASTCSNGVCTSGGAQADLFEGIGTGATTHLGTGSAIGIVAGVLGLGIIIFVIGFFCVRGRRRRQPIMSEEAPPPDVGRSISARTKKTIGRSASAATKWTVDNDQKTLVASLPNSPQDARFYAQREAMPEYYTQVGKLDEIVEKSEPAQSRRGVSRNPTSSTRASSVNKALPTPPQQEMRYAINVSINKSMIFEDSLFSASAPQTPRSRAPRYRFEEVLPRVPGSTPRISITKPKTTAQTSRPDSEYEMDSYPRNRQSEALSEVETRSRGSTQYGQAQIHDVRGHALKRLEGKLPPLPPQAHVHGQPFDTVPPSPSFSFRSYDWYREIIDQPAAPPRTPDLSSRANAQGTNPLLSHPLTADPSLIPAPLSSAPSTRVLSHLHPSSALTLDSPTSPDFRLSPTVYQMPSRTPHIVPTPPITRPSSVSTTASYRSGHPRYASWMPNDDSMIPEDDLPLPRLPRHQSMAASLAMTSEFQTPAQTRRGSKATLATVKSRGSMIWLPDIGWHLPEEESEDSFAVFKRDYLDGRPQSYSPLT